MEQGKARGRRKGLTEPTDTIDESLLLETQIETSIKLEKQVYREYKETNTLFKRVMEPSTFENVRLEVEYLDEMIKQESLQIMKLNKEVNKLKRLDVV